MKYLIAVFAVFVLFAVPAAAQTPIPNPGNAEWDPSPDHATIDSYAIGYFLTGATEPVQTADLGKPTPGPDGKCRAPINVKPLGFARYTAKLIVKAGAVTSAWSEPSNPFERVPLPAGNLVVK